MEEPVSLSIIPSLLCFVLGLVYTTATVLLPDASVGRAYEPKIFPMMLGIALIILSLSLLLRELKNQSAGQDKEKVSLYKEAGFQKILMTCLFSVLYTLIFDKAGYVISTVFFLEMELILFNGKKNWKVNTAVAVLFSLFIYIVFSKLLGVYLPLTPGIWI
ncbi:MAG: hypothetical protein B6241_09495 [Spirochaetaceae bacterium 4572_59]|nr:MAG: hypothetical protein B6241_09495 [Spirochaetaceae bacterium 4572_59]